MDKAVEDVERAMVAVRRRQRRRVLAGGAGAHYDVLDVLEEVGPAATVSSVAAALSVDQPRASKLVATAVAEGLVRRVADQADGRRALLEPTASGREALARMHSVRQEAFAGAMAGWSEEERVAFARLLGRFVSALGPG